MVGEIRLGFHVDGIGFYRDCSELMYKIDSSSNLKVFKEGEIIEMDEALFKIEAVELGFVPYPGRKNFERQKPIKLVYVSKASALTGETKIRNAVKLEDIEPTKDLNVKEEDIKVDKGYNKEEFKEEFSHVIKPEQKRKGRTKKNETPIRKRVSKKAKKKDESKPEVTKKPKAIKVEGKKRSTGGDKSIKIVPSEPVKKKTKAKAKVKAKSKTEDTVAAPKKHSRRKRCPGCQGLFKSLGRHKCKTK